MNLGFRIFRFSILEIFYYSKIILGNLVVRYRGKNNKGVLERPWTKLMVLRAISSTVRFQFTVKCWKIDFLMSSKTRSCQSSREKLRMHPPNFNLNYQKNTFCVKLDFSRFTNRSLVCTVCTECIIIYVLCVLYAVYALCALYVPSGYTLKTTK